MGIHHLWRRRLLRLVPPSQSQTVLDLCTGTGDLLLPLRRRFGTVIGADFSFPMLSEARQKGQNQAVQPQIVQGDALRLPFGDRTFDLVTVAFGVRNFERLVDGLIEIRRVLKEGGQLLVLEFGQPTGAFWGNLFGLYSSFIMPLIGGLLTGNRAAYTYLPESVAAFPEGEAFLKICRNAGFTQAEWHPLTFGICALYLLEK